MVECSFIYAYLAPLIALIMIPFGITVMLIAGTIFNEDKRLRSKIAGALLVWGIGQFIFIYGILAMTDFVGTCF